mmetsp:Transcript_52688/g.104667  ORF Transcript_52688/g.104667 Transcript_52688/m.104667 type:complete len:234 (-) Transcript_52688:754-1455(-)
MFHHNNHCNNHYCYNHKHNSNQNHCTGYSPSGAAAQGVPSVLCRKRTSLVHQMQLANLCDLLRLQRRCAANPPVSWSHPGGHNSDDHQHDITCVSNNQADYHSSVDFNHIDHHNTSAEKAVYHNHGSWVSALPPSLPTAVEALDCRVPVGYMQPMFGMLSLNYWNNNKRRIATCCPQHNQHDYSNHDYSRHSRHSSCWLCVHSTQLGVSDHRLPAQSDGWQLLPSETTADYMC